VVLLSGGTGGAKLAAGLAGLLPAEDLTVVANTGDDIEIYGALVSPDPDLVSFWLAGLIDQRGWGLVDDSFAVMDGLRALGVDVWFNLGDRDLAWCLRRSELLAGGLSPAAALAHLNEALGQRVAVLPMSEQPVRTWVSTPATGWCAFQEFMIAHRGAGPVDGLEFRGAELAGPGEAVLAAIAAAQMIVIGPSNPLVSIGPILAVPGMREALQDATAPVVAVSPIVGGEVLKGPTAAFMAFAGVEPNAAGISALYTGLLDGIVADEPVQGGAALQTDTRMDNASDRARLAAEVLAFAATLAR
jgi:LPPG:FO 2-phospho-L-lactate transferase